MATAPKGFKWLDERELAVRCETCSCIFTQPYVGYNGKILGGIPTNGCPVCRREAKENRRRALPLDPVLVAAVKQYAHDNYEQGWDEVVECYDNAAIWEVIAGSKTPAAAIRKMWSVAKMRNERADDIRSTAW